ncbi:DUF6087 family protein [Streptomyces sp. NPDC056831]|uniref:DUF6087 family protein n=1 Tax=Streptomyces sp. NPDC056831 TaxID=3345954 RepID=UPI0036B29856
MPSWADGANSPRQPGRRPPLPSGPKGSHRIPEAPRVIQRWNGYAWELHQFAANLAEAQRLLHPRDEEPPTTVTPVPSHSRPAGQAPKAPPGRVSRRCYRLSVCPGRLSRVAVPEQEG